MAQITLEPVVPGVVAATVGEAVTADEARAFFELLRVRAESEPFALVLDGTALGARGRLRLAGVGAACIAGMLALPAPDGSRGITGCAFAVRAFEARALAGVIIAASRPAWPTRVVQSLDEAHALARGWAPRVADRAAESAVEAARRDASHPP